MTNRTAPVDHHAYWRQFESTVSFLEPCQVVGTIEVLGKLETRDGAAPQLKLRVASGAIVIVNAVQTRLLAELVRLEPAVGDRIKIIYRGQSSKAAPGMQPTKEFEVVVRAANERAVDPATGEVGPPTDPTADRGAAVDAPGPDQGTDGTVDGPTPPASTDPPGTVPGPGPDETPDDYVDTNGRVHVPDERPDVVAVKARIDALTTLERTAFLGWLAKAKLDIANPSPAKVRAINTELDRRAAQPPPTT